MERRTVLTGIGVLLFAGGLAGGAAMARAGEEEPRRATPREAVPVYDGAGQLLRPEGWEEWVVVGTSMGLSYSEGDEAGSRGPDDPPGLFHSVLVPAWARDAYRAAGTFPDRTMLALAIYDVETDAPPRERGFYQGELLALELHVKDIGRFEGGWGFFNFGAEGERAEVLPGEASCYRCHAEHAEKDDVFTQFYPLLRGRGSDAAGP